MTGLSTLLTATEQMRKLWPSERERMADYRMTPEQLQRIRANLDRLGTLPPDAQRVWLDENTRSLLRELAAVTRERDDAREKYQTVTDKYSLAADRIAELIVERDDWRAKYEATVSAWEEAKAAREKSDTQFREFTDWFKANYRGA